ncbi:MAG TPA: hypothetical protein PKH97_14060 [Tetrasphaera sp.]|uniref:hypothetical protein n=1 Tax=Nostocoides sp. TaxID=1917966 RepID=UPI002CC9EF24|nr:hypothetical protein [Tetrasphaera sp.]HNQ08296.1 hypothetical protein [Tetrasphaera sp.]
MADTVGVRSRSAKTPDAPTILWIGRVDGTFTIGESETPLDQPGTEVRIQPRHGDLEWCNESTTRKLTSDFAEILDVPVRIKGDLLSLNTPPWERTIEEQLTWCRERLGFEVMGIVPLDSSLLTVRRPGLRPALHRGSWAAHGRPDLLQRHARRRQRRSVDPRVGLLLPRGHRRRRVAADGLPRVAAGDHLPPAGP